MPKAVIVAPFTGPLTAVPSSNADVPVVVPPPQPPRPKAANMTAASEQVNFLPFIFVPP
jgi:hypothetical protein